MTTKLLSRAFAKLLLACSLAGMLSVAHAEEYLDAEGTRLYVYMYKITHKLDPERTPRPGTSISGAPVTYRLVALPPEVYAAQAASNLDVQRVGGGPYSSQEEVIADAANFQLVSVAKKDAIPVFDAKGNHLQKYTTMVPVIRSGSKPASAAGSGTSQPKPAGSPSPSPGAPQLQLKLVAVKGVVTVERVGEPIVTLGPANVGSFAFRVGDRIYTEQDSSAKLESPDGNMEIGDNADVKLLEASIFSKAKITQQRGNAVIEIKGTPAEYGEFTLVTPTVTIKDDGTKFTSRHDPKDQGTRISVQEGKVFIRPTNPNLAPRVLSAGQSITVFPDRYEPPDAGQPADASKLRGLSAPTRTARAGTQLTVPVSLQNVATDAASGLGNVNFEVRYDPNVVTVAGKIARGNISGSGMLFEGNAKDSGLIRIGFAGERGVTQSGTVAQIPFKVVGQPGQQTDLTLRIIQSQTPGGQSVVLPTTNGRITIPGTDGQTAAASSSSSGAHASTASSPPPSSAAGSSGAPAAQGSTPNLRNADGTTRGDCNGDGKLTSMDAECALQMSVGTRPVDLNLDIDQDGQVMSADSRRILQEAPGMMSR